MKLCLDCPVDISHRRHDALRCAGCSDKHDRELRRSPERREQNRLYQAARQKSGKAARHLMCRPMPVETPHRVSKKCPACSDMPWARQFGRKVNGFGSDDVVNDNGECIGCGGRYAPEQ